ncbi:MAG: hypothetical protein DRP87_03900 [Spirochaetes bacterium]|nr:MAG: hypothetical protein DRP87_03900 [Spirochaetota bacterium]
MPEKILLVEDEAIVAIAVELLAEEGLQFHLKSSITEVEQRSKQIVLRYRQNEEESEIAGTHLLVATGRIPASGELELDSAGIEIDERGYILVDDYCRTSQGHIYTLGDVNGRGAFTHTSVHDGQVFLDHFLRRGGRRISDRKMTYAMHIDPPLARVGINELEAAKTGIDCLVGSMPMSSVSRAREKAETGGTIKVVVEKESKKILGATVFGVGGDEIIGMIALAMQAELPYTALQHTVIPHPTVSELVPWIFNNLKPLPLNQAWYSGCRLFCNRQLKGKPAALSECTFNGKLTPVSPNKVVERFN